MGGWPLREEDPVADIAYLLVIAAMAIIGDSPEVARQESPGACDPTFGLDLTPGSFGQNQVDIGAIHAIVIGEVLVGWREGADPLRRGMHLPAPGLLFHPRFRRSGLVPLFGEFLISRRRNRLAELL